MLTFGSTEKIQVDEMLAAGPTDSPELIDVWRNIHLNTTVFNEYWDFVFAEVGQPYRPFDDLFTDTKFESHFYNNSDGNLTIAGSVFYDDKSMWTQGVNQFSGWSRYEGEYIVVSAHGPKDLDHQVYGLYVSLKKNEEDQFVTQVNVYFTDQFILATIDCVWEGTECKVVDSSGDTYIFSKYPFINIKW